MHLLVASTSLDGVLLLNSGRRGTAWIFFWLDQGCHLEATRSARVVACMSPCFGPKAIQFPLIVFYLRSMGMLQTSARKGDPETWMGEKITEQSVESLY